MRVAKPFGITPSRINLPWFLNAGVELEPRQRFIPLGIGATAPQGHLRDRAPTDKAQMNPASMKERYRPRPMMT